ncbi:MAG: dihydroorotase, partial [Planctomycetaceae bacterium]
MSESWIRGGRVLDPGSEFDGLADVWIRGGRIAAVVSPGTMPADASPGAPVLDAAGLLVCPGFVDLHVSLR